jgi:hypothetical protein
MFQSKDGKKFGSAFVAKRRDKEHEQSMGVDQPTKGTEPKEEPRTDMNGEALMSKANANAPDNNVKASPEGVDAGQVAAEHGPANTVHVAHDHKANKHHVTSTHSDGHVHTSEHGSSKEAHDAASQLSNAGDQPNENQENEAPESDGFSMPKLA